MAKRKKRNKDSKTVIPEGAPVHDPRWFLVDEAEFDGQSETTNHNYYVVEPHKVYDRLHRVLLEEKDPVESKLIDWIAKASPGDILELPGTKWAPTLLVCLPYQSKPQIFTIRRETKKVVTIESKLFDQPERPSKKLPKPEKKDRKKDKKKKHRHVDEDEGDD